MIVIGASAGGVAALQFLLNALPRQLPAAGFVVLHRSPDRLPFDPDDDCLPWALTHHTLLPGEAAADGKRIEPGRIYVAPRAVHLLVEHGVMRLEAGPPEARSRSRPSIDVLFVRLRNAMAAEL